MDDLRNTASAPLDTATLDRQTLGDPVLKDEILALFIEQARLTDSLAGGGRDPSIIAAQLHRFKGSARAVGARKAEAEADRLEAQIRHASERNPPSENQTKAFRTALAEACDYAATLRSGIA